MLLDTSFLIDLLEGRSSASAMAAEIDRLDETPHIPSPVLFELWEGAEGSVQPATERARLEELLESYEVAPFDGEAAKAAGELQAELSRKGRPLGTIDVLVAGLALARDETLVTGDQALMRLRPRIRIKTHSES